MYVRVVDSEGTVLMPTKRLGWVTHALKSGEAVIFCRFPFTIMLTRKVERPFYQEMSAGLDTGFVHVGGSVTTKKKEICRFEFTDRTKDIKKGLDEKRTLRSHRRNRNTRYRKPRFSNRVATKKKGWMPPTGHHMVNSNADAFDILVKYLPITKGFVETGSFDTQKLKDPNIEGEEYQQGLMTGFKNAEAFVRWRDGNICRQCNGKSKDKSINVHHIKPRKLGGTDHPNNLVCLCETCHTKYHNGEIKLKNFGLDSKTAKSLRDAAAMNVISKAIIEEIRKRHPEIEIKETFGYITKANRKKYKLEKSHTNDALIVSHNFEAELCDITIACKQVRRHNRQLHKTNPKKGVRRANQAAYLIKGFALNDYVELDGKFKGFVTGRMSTGYATVKTIDGEKLHKDTVVSMKRLKLIRHSKSILYEYRKSSDSSAPAERSAVFSD